MDKKLIILSFFLCNFGMISSMTFYQYQYNEKTKLKCMFLSNGLWKKSTRKKKNIGEDFPNHIGCQLDLNILHNNNKIILKADKNYEVDATFFTEAIATLLKTNPTAEEPLFIELTRHTTENGHITSSDPFHYKVTEILKPLPVHVKYYQYTEKEKSMKMLNGTEWKSSERKPDITPRFCALKFSKNHTTPSSMQPINEQTEQPKGWESCIETPSPEVQKLIKEANKPGSTYLLIEIGNDLY